MLPTRAIAHAPSAKPLHLPNQPRTSGRPQVRRYTTTTLLANGDICETRHLAPALPLFEDAFCAFARGTLVETDMGPIAIEDLLPGDRVVTGDGAIEEVIWKGNVTIVPGLKPSVQKRDMRLTRFTADSLGLARPMTSIMCGPSARLLHTPDRIRAMAGGNQVLSPVRTLVDGVNVIESAPPTPVELYHICLPRHATLKIGGLEFESYHPGPQSARMISHAMRALFLDLFPHVDTLGGFGPVAYPRAGDGQIDAIG
ncbi:MAG: Hint domain-containing protein [Paracoccaceae bacterium]